MLQSLRSRNAVFNAQVAIWLTRNCWFKPASKRPTGKEAKDAKASPKYLGHLETRRWPLMACTKLIWYHLHLTQMRHVTYSCEESGMRWNDHFYHYAEPHLTSQRNLNQNSSFLVSLLDTVHGNIGVYKGPEVCQKIRTFSLAIVLPRCGSKPWIRTTTINYPRLRDRYFTPRRSWPPRCSKRPITSWCGWNMKLNSVHSGSSPRELIYFAQSLLLKSLKS